MLTWGQRAVQQLTHQTGHLLHLFVLCSVFVGGKCYGQERRAPVGWLRFQVKEIVKGIDMLLIMVLFRKYAKQILSMGDAAPYSMEKKSSVCHGYVETLYSLQK